MERFKRINEIIVKMSNEDYVELRDAYWTKALGGIDNFITIIKKHNLTFEDVKYWLEFND